jgi:hypothetical protein
MVAPAFKLELQVKNSFGKAHPNSRQLSATARETAYKIVMIDLNARTNMLENVKATGRCVT